MVLNEIAKEEKKKKQPFVRSSKMLEGPGTDLYGCAFNHFKASRDSEVAVVGKNSVSIYHLPARFPEIRQLFNGILKTEYNEELFAVTWAYQNKKGEEKLKIVTGGKTGRLYVIDVKSMTVDRTLVGCGGAVNTIRTSPTNTTLIAVASEDASARIFDIRAETCLVIIGGKKGNLGNVLSVSWVPDGNHIITAGFDHIVIKWDLVSSEISTHLVRCEHRLNKGEVPSNPKIYEHNTRRACANGIFNPHGYTIFVTTPTHCVRDLHFDTVDCVRVIKAAGKNYVLSKVCGKESSIVLWRFGNQDGSDHVGPGETSSSHTTLVSKHVIGGAFWFSMFEVDPQGRWLVVGGENGVVQFHDLKNRDELRSEIATYTANVGKMPRQFAFSRNGKMFLLVGDNGLMERFDKNPGF